MPKGDNNITVEIVRIALSQPTTSEALSLFERREQSMLPWKKEELLQLNEWLSKQDARGLSSEKTQEYEQIRQGIDLCLRLLSDDILEYKLEEKRPALAEKGKKEHKEAANVEDEITEELARPKPSVEKVSALMAKLTIHEPVLPYAIVSKRDKTPEEAKHEYSLRQILAEALSTNTSILSVKLRGVSSNDDLALLMAEVLKKNRTLKTLEFAPVGEITDVGATAIAKALAENNTLTSLTIWHNKISIGGGKALADALKENRTLKTFNLFANKTTYFCAAKFAEAFKIHPALTDINLGFNDLGSRGAEEIMESLSESDTCRSLGLGGLMLGDDEEDDMENAGKVADFIENHPTLTEIDLGKNKFGRSSLQLLLSAIQENRNIEVIKLDDNPGVSSPVGKQIAAQLEANKKFKRDYRASITLLLLLQSPLPAAVVQLMLSYLEPQNYYGASSDAQQFLDASKTAYRSVTQPSFFTSPASKPVPVNISLLTSMFQGYKTLDMTGFDKAPRLVITLDHLETDATEKAYRIKSKLVIMLREFFKLRSLTASAGLDSRTGFITIRGVTQTALQSELAKSAAPVAKSGLFHK